MTETTRMPKSPWGYLRRRKITLRADTYQDALTAMNILTGVSITIDPLLKRQTGANFDWFEEGVATDEADPNRYREVAEALRESEGYMDIDRYRSAEEWSQHVVEPVVAALVAAGWTVEPAT